MKAYWLTVPPTSEPHVGLKILKRDFQIKAIIFSWMRFFRSWVVEFHALPSLLLLTISALELLKYLVI